MGYYTEYTIGIYADPDVVLLNDETAGDKSIDAIHAFLESNEFGYQDTFEFMANTKTWHSMDTIKWYEHDKDMKRLTLIVPNVVLMLSGRGEEEDDVWRKYYVNGRVQETKAKITYKYEDFDMAKLKDIE